tara:strand:+ start:6561 stop:6893 length:333 start_codon:yes stop_codon:yes gene_type:complete
MTYSPKDTSRLIDDLAKLCDEKEEWLIRLEWPGKGNTATYPWPDMGLGLSFTDETLETFEIQPFEKQLPATYRKVTLTGDGFFRTITRADLEIVLTEFLAEYGGSPNVTI